MDKEKLSTSANLLRLSTLGINFVLCTFAGVGLGFLAKKWFELGDGAVLAGFFFGVITSYVVLYKDLKILTRDNPKAPKP